MIAFCSKPLYVWNLLDVWSATSSIREQIFREKSALMGIVCEALI
jgi:hypothetical protein